MRCMLVLMGLVLAGLKFAFLSLERRGENDDEGIIIGEREGKEN